MQSQEPHEDDARDDDSDEWPEWIDYGDPVGQSRDEAVCCGKN